MIFILLTLNFKLILFNDLNRKQYIKQNLNDYINLAFKQTNNIPGARFKAYFSNLSIKFQKEYI